MTDEARAVLIRRAIGGDAASIFRILSDAKAHEDALVVTMAALIERDAARLANADGIARTSRDRQVVAIARAHLAGDAELVDALARDHLVTYPGQPDRVVDRVRPAPS